ncbi:MAG: SPOR domain-containing protein [Ottowia sp.]|uniref:SPOR domain-containing protein n=1 Tax=Ottowia sp. TaxID=1898956 RepID=UPI0039E5FDA7
MIGRLVVLLLAANLVWAAWSQGWLRSVGLGPAQQAEPERLERQVRPESLRIQPLPDAGAAPAPVARAEPAAPRRAPEPTSSAPEAPAPAASAAGTCLQAGVFDDKQIEPVRRAAAELPAGSWRIDQVSLPGRWMVYVGKLADAEAVRAKRAELRELGVDTDRPGAALEPGLSLGRFANEESADRALADLARKGVRSARVVQERRDTPAYLLRLPAADAALRQQAAGLRGALAGKELRPCE